MTDEVLGPCECFTMLESRQNAPGSQCEVCDHVREVHDQPGMRVLSGGEIETLRKRILIERFERRQKDAQRTPDPMNEVRSNGDPEIH